jgi:hypothetical protein
MVLSLSLGLSSGNVEFCTLKNSELPINHYYFLLSLYQLSVVAFSSSFQKKVIFLPVH